MMTKDCIFLNYNLQMMKKRFGNCLFITIVVISILILLMIKISHLLQSAIN